MKESTFLSTVSPSFLPKARTVPGNIVEIQSISAGKLMNTSLKRKESQSLLVKVIFFKCVSFVISLYVFTLLLLGRVLPPSMVSRGPLVTPSPPNQHRASHQLLTIALLVFLLDLYSCCFVPNPKALLSLSTKGLHIPQSQLFLKGFLTHSLLGISTGPGTSQMELGMH